VSCCVASVSLSHTIHLKCTSEIQLKMVENIFSLGSVIVFILTLCLGLALYHSITRPRGSPPGPPLLPFIGNFHVMLRKDTRNLFRELRDKYGDIYSLNIGYTQWIIFNSYDVLKEMFVTNGEFTSERPYIASMSFEGKPFGMWKGFFYTHSIS